MKAAEFGQAIEPKWELGERLVKEVRGAVDERQLSPLDGARVISSITATLFATTSSSCARSRRSRFSRRRPRGGEQAALAG